jgi:hypothetical protein
MPIATQLRSVASRVLTGGIIILLLLMKNNCEKERDQDHHLQEKETTITIVIITISQDMSKIIDKKEDIITQLPPTNKKRESIKPPERVDTMIPKQVLRRSLRKKFCHQRDPKTLNKAL